MWRYSIDKGLQKFVGSSPVMRGDDEGEWVEYASAMAEINRLRAELKCVARARAELDLISGVVVDAGGSVSDQLHLHDAVRELVGGLVKERDEARAAIKELLVWRKWPEVCSAFTLQALHGGVSQEIAERADWVWKNAENALGK